MKQVSVFIENKAGSLRRLTGILKDNDINILSFSLADTENYGLMRFIVDDTERALSVLKMMQLSASVVDVYAIMMKNEVGEIHRMLEALRDIQIEYMYPASTVRDLACVICRIPEADEEAAETALRHAGFSYDGPNGTYDA